MPERQRAAQLAQQGPLFVARQRKAPDARAEPRPALRQAPVPMPEYLALRRRSSALGQASEIEQSPATGQTLPAFQRREVVVTARHLPAVEKLAVSVHDDGGPRAGNKVEYRFNRPYCWPWPALTGLERVRYRPGVTAELPPDSTPSMTVFRPTRRCPKCGLVNVTGAKRCRRCERVLEAFDRGEASERLVNRMRSRRRMFGIAIALSIGALVVMGIGLKWRLDSASRFGEESRAVDADVTTLLRGARTDAAILVEAFDDREFTALLAAQGPTWAERQLSCETLRDRARELAPRGEQQTRIAADIERRLDEVSAASAQLALAAESSDITAGRAAAAQLIASKDSGAEIGDS